MTGEKNDGMNYGQSMQHSYGTEYQDFGTEFQKATEIDH